MRVVLDSSILCRDFHLSSSHFRVFLNEATRTGHTVYVPEVVFEEVANKFCELLASHVEEVNRAIQKVERFAAIRLRRPIGQRRVRQYCARYRRELRDKLAPVASFLGYPAVTHQDLVSRALKRFRPFQPKGTGYRDALLWHNVLELASAGDPEDIALVTANSADFAIDRANPETLHPDLVQDLSSLQDRTCNVLLFADLRTFVDRQIISELQRIEQIRAQLQSASFPGFDIPSFLDRDLSLFVGAQELDPQELGFFGGIETPTLSHVEDLTELRVIDVRRLSSGELLVDVTIEGEMIFDFFIPKWKLYGAIDNTPIVVWDSDWNEYYAFAGTALRARLGLLLILDENEGQVTSAEIKSAEPMEEWWRRFPEI